MEPEGSLPHSQVPITCPYGVWILLFAFSLFTLHNIPRGFLFFYILVDNKLL